MFGALLRGPKVTSLCQPWDLNWQPSSFSKPEKPHTTQFINHNDAIWTYWQSVYHWLQAQVPRNQYMVSFVLHIISQTSNTDKNSMDFICTEIYGYLFLSYIVTPQWKQTKKCQIRYANLEYVRSTVCLTWDFRKVLQRILTAFIIQVARCLEITCHFAAM